jgi:tetratricopeptide (TPR) repeat protein
MTTTHDVMKWQVLALAIGLFPGGRVAAADLSSDYSAARVLYEGRHYAEAREIFRRLSTDQPESVEVSFYLGRLALWFDEETAACSYLEKAARGAPSEAHIQNALGDAFGLMAQKAGWLAKLGWAQKCLAAYERAVELDPLKPAYRWSLLGFYCVAPRIAGGGRDKAALQAEAIRRLDPMGGRIAFATVCLSESRPAAAFSQFDDLLQENADHFLALYQVGRCAALSGEQLERGRVALQRCLQLTPPSGEGMPTWASAHHRLGNILEKMGDRTGAAEHYVAARKVHPDFRAEKDMLRN